MDDNSLGHQKAYCARTLRESSITETPDLEARLLIEKATSLTQIEQILHPDRILSSTELFALEHMLTERLQSRPMAYILGYKEFYGRSFLVDERVLIPRPDTETLVDVALSYARQRDERLLIIDVCTGSGCVGVSLACELGYDVTLTDISSDALLVARENAARLVGHALPTIQGDLLSTHSHKYDIIVSNPPYLTREWWEEVSDDVKREPHLALEGFGQDGLELIRTLVDQSSITLKDKGALMLECDYRQVAEVRNIMLAAGFVQIKIECDLGGRERVVWGIHNCTNNL